MSKSIDSVLRAHRKIQAAKVVPSVVIIGRSETVEAHRYHVQTQARAGNWVMCLGTDEKKLAIDMALHYAKNGDAARVVDNTK